MTSYQYRKSHCGDKTILRPSYLRNGISYTGKMTSSYSIGALDTSCWYTFLSRQFCRHNNTMAPFSAEAGVFWENKAGICVTPGPQFNIKMLSYQYRKSHCGDKTVVRSSYLHNGISYPGKMSSLYWIGPQNKCPWLLIPYHHQDLSSQGNDHLLWTDHCLHEEIVQLTTLSQCRKWKNETKKKLS